MMSFVLQLSQAVIIGSHDSVTIVHGSSRLHLVCRFLILGGHLSSWSSSSPSSLLVSRLSPTIALLARTDHTFNLQTLPLCILILPLSFETWLIPSTLHLFCRSPSPHHWSGCHGTSRAVKSGGSAHTRLALLLAGPRGLMAGTERLLRGTSKPLPVSLSSCVLCGLFLLPLKRSQLSLPV